MLLRVQQIMQVIGNLNCCINAVLSKAYTLGSPYQAPFHEGRVYLLLAVLSLANRHECIEQLRIRKKFLNV